MRYSRALKLLLVGVFIAAAGNVFAQAQVGQPAPDFTRTGNDGQTYTLSALQDHVVFLWMVGYA